MPPLPDTGTTNTSSSDDEKSIDLSQAVGKAAGWLASDKSLSNGDRAELRRIAPEAPFTPALWKVLYRLRDEGAAVAIGNEWQERTWATLLMGMAFCISPSLNLHDYDTPLGQALAEAGWSETRFVRLMEADPDTLPVLVRRMAQYLASKQQPANWADVAWLLFTRSSERSEDTRLRIARSYYGTLHTLAQDA